MARKRQFQVLERRFVAHFRRKKLHVKHKYSAQFFTRIRQTVRRSMPKVSALRKKAGESRAKKLNRQMAKIWQGNVWPW